MAGSKGIRSIVLNILIFVNFLLCLHLTLLDYRKSELEITFLPYLSFFSSFLISHILLASIKQDFSPLSDPLSFIPPIPYRVFLLLASQQLRRFDESKGECMKHLFFAGGKRKMVSLCVLRQYAGRNYALGNNKDLTVLSTVGTWM